MRERLTAQNINERTYVNKVPPVWVRDIIDATIESNWDRNIERASVDGTILKNLIEKSKGSMHDEWAWNHAGIIEAYSEVGFHIKTESHRNETIFIVTKA